MSDLAKLIAATERGGCLGVVSENAGRWFDAVPGERVCIRVHGSAVGGRYSIMESVSQPAATTPMHTHREDEVFHILDGTLTFEVGGRRIDAPAGTIVVVPAGVPHAWANFGNGPARCAMTFTPGGIEDLFPMLGGLVPEAIMALASSYGTAVVGPPIER